jgi:hypothetical protein
MNDYPKLKLKMQQVFLKKIDIYENCGENSIDPHISNEVLQKSVLHYQK